MILFAEDWAKYPTAQPHWNTKAQTFIDLAKVYKAMGLENHLFHLALIDQSLADIDPYDEDLTQEQMLAISIECKINPWYFFREVARIPAGSGADAAPLQANRANIAAFWCFFNHATIFIIQPRQTGKSISIDELITYLMNIRCKNTDINLLSKDETLRQNNIKRLKNIEAELPIYLKQRTKGDVNNTEALSIQKLGNRFLTHVPQASPKAANNMGRGLTSPITIVDEAPFQPNIGIAIPAAFAAGTDARNRAASAGEPYGNIFTTTAGKKDDRDGAFIYNILQNSFVFTEKLFDCKDEKAFVKMVCTNSGFADIPYINLTFDHLQLGKDNAWLRRAIQNTPGITAEMADRDFFNRWTAGSQSSPLTVELLEKIRASQQEAKYIEISKINSYVTRWYVPQSQIESRMKNGWYVMSLDTSDASGGDDISLTMQDSRTGEIIATGTYNETNIITFSEWIASWFSRFSNFVAIIERRSTGSSIIDNLLLILPSLGIDPFKRLYNRVVQEADEEPQRFREVCLTSMGRRNPEIYVKYKKAFGFATSGGGLTSRSDLYSSTLQAAASLVGHLIRDAKIVDQLTGLVIKNNRVDHVDGGHDDTVITWLLSNWLLTKGKGLAHYGLDVAAILSDARRSGIVNKTADAAQTAQDTYRSEIEELAEKLKNEKDQFIVTKIEHRMRFLSTKLRYDEKEKFSVDELILSTKEKRKEMVTERASKASQSNIGGVFERYSPQNMARYTYRDPNVFSVY